ncbi:hypothetical protein CR513_50507, partial [Mucuna pruriens]
MNKGEICRPRAKAGAGRNEVEAKMTTDKEIGAEKGVRANEQLSLTGRRNNYEDVPVRKVKITTNRKSTANFPMPQKERKVPMDGRVQIIFPGTKSNVGVTPSPHQANGRFTNNLVNAALVQEAGKNQHPIYFGIETRYQKIEKAGLALAIGAQKLRPYFQSN